MKFLGGENFKFPEMEEKILQHWREIGAFEKSLALRQARGKKRTNFIFYEGPPTANAGPGIHHVLARVFKDIICRFKTMRGFYVERKAGWDTHGLPVELQVEKALGMNSKKDIEAYGVAKFNQQCKESVWKYKDEWEKLTERIAFWLDMKNPYITYQTPYIETLWEIVKQFWKRKLLYKGHKVVPWCTRCGTGLSSHEMAQGYKIAKDRSVTVKFEIRNSKFEKNPKLKFLNDKPLYILAWTTTPWTLPGNVALAVGKDIEYVILESPLEGGVLEGHENNRYVAEGPGFYIFAKERFGAYAKDINIDAYDHFLLRAREEGFDFETIPGVKKIVKGSDLVGLEYKPLFDVSELHGEKSYKIYAADFVTTEDGTGVVHTAVMYGEDDYQLGSKVGLPKFHTVEESGKFVDSVPAVASMYARAEKTTEAIFEHLKNNGTFLTEEKYEHEYPHCWRCGTALLYYARDSWFVAMSKLKKELLKNNQSINWIPAHIKNGRFGEWLKDVKDWNFSRARYWGTPLPVWECEGCGHFEVVGSREELAGKLRSAKNKYFAMRHGMALSNLRGTAAPIGEEFHLTLKGNAQVDKAARKLKKEKIDIVVASDVLRTKETALKVARLLGIENVYFDKRLREINVGIFEGSDVRGYHHYYRSFLEKFTKAPPEGETLSDLRARMLEALIDLETRYEGKNILLVSHEYPIWMLYGGALGLNDEETAALRTGKRKDDFVTFAEVIEIPYRKLPRNEQLIVDLHRPYVDAITFACSKCKGVMKRIEELADVWFDSGAMPFAQSQYPFAFAQNKKLKIRNQKESQWSMVSGQKLATLAYPADYICEAVDQTRGWFYTLLAVSTALGYKAPYKNVISLGHILDKNGEKMSKSKGNVVNPWDMIQKYGSDAIRWHFYTVNPPGEPIKFDENELGATVRRFFLTLYNVYVFYETYADKKVQGYSSSVSRSTNKNILDTWIYARLQQTINEATHHLEAFEVGKAALTIESFVDDLSRWYLRRSRRRLQKPENKSDYVSASAMLFECLKTTAVLIAPFAPFFAEALYVSLPSSVKDRATHSKRGNRGGGAPTVHLADWPKVGKAVTDKRLLENMDSVRQLAAEVLKIRAEKGIKVRQPLQKLQITNYKLKKWLGLLDILKDEVNVKEIIFGKSVELDTNVTPELKEEGVVRELVRAIQDLRKDANYRPKDKITISLQAGETLTGIFKRNEKVIKSEVGAKTISHARLEKHEAEKEFVLDGEKVLLCIHKVS